MLNIFLDAIINIFFNGMALIIVGLILLLMSKILKKEEFYKIGRIEIITGTILGMITSFPVLIIL